MSQFSDNKTIGASAVLCALDYVEIYEDSRGHTRGSNAVFRLILSGITGTDFDLLDGDEEEGNPIYPEAI